MASPKTERPEGYHPEPPPINLKAIQPDPRAVDRAFYVFNLLNQTAVWPGADRQWRSLESMSKAQKVLAAEKLMKQSNQLVLNYMAAQRQTTKPQNMSDYEWDNHLESQLDSPRKWMASMPLYKALKVDWEKTQSLIDEDPGGEYDGDYRHSLNCHCKRCNRSARAIRAQAARQARIARFAADPTLAEHGKPGTYSNYACRCTPCIKANTQAKKERAARLREKNLISA